MNIYNASILKEEYSGKEKQEIINFINNSNANHNSQLSFLKIKDDSGWTYLTAKINQSEFLIKYSSCMSDASSIIKFFADIIDLKEDAALFLDNEGSEPLFYVIPIKENEVRFIFAHDYELFLNDDIYDYGIGNYKMECDIIIEKKTLLNEFYNIFYPFTINYDLEKAYEPVFNIEQGKKYLDKIEKYLKL